MPPTGVGPVRPPAAVSTRRAERRPALPRPRGPRGLFAAALALSALIHLLVFLIFRFSVLVPGEAWLLESRPDAVPAQPGMQVIDIRPVAAAPEPVPSVESRTPPPAPVRPTPAAEPRTTTVEAGEAVARPRSLAERIVPRASDPRLWVPILPPVERPLTADEEVRARVVDRLAAWNDSMASEAEAAARALDWTHTDASGNKWGISPGKIHLGSVTLPLPFGFGPPPSVRAEMMGRVEAWEAIERQAADGKTRDEFRDRIKAIRELQEAKRDSTRKTKK